MDKKKSSHKNRPSGVTILTVYYLILVVLNVLLVSIFFYLEGDILATIVLSISSILFWVLYSMCAYGLWNLKAWGRLLSIVISGFALISTGVITMAILGNLAGHFMYYTLSPSTLGLSYAASDANLSSSPYWIFLVFLVSVIIAILAINSVIIWYLTRPNISRVFH